MPSPRFKIPQSVLVVIHTAARQVLLIRRADWTVEPYWQSVTGSKDSPAEPFAETAQREVFEETGIVADAPGHVLTDWGIENVYDIYPSYRSRYAPGVTRNTEHLFGLLVPPDSLVRLNPREHTAYQWLDWRSAAAACHSASNAEACLLLPRFTSGAA